MQSSRIYLVCSAVLVVVIAMCLILVIYFKSRNPNTTLNALDGTLGETFGCPASYAVPPVPDQACGSNAHGGAACSDDCCNAQVQYCHDTCSLAANPGGCYHRCMADRNCNGSKTTTCPSTYNVNAGPTPDDQTTRCGQGYQGGTNCASECCDKQFKFSNSQCAGWDSLEQVACCVREMTRRGCPDYDQCQSTP